MSFAHSESAEEVRAALGVLLRQRRESVEMRLAEVAAAAGMSPAYLSEVERGLKDISTERLVALCRALRTPLGELYLELSRMLGAASHLPAMHSGADPRQQIRMATAMLTGEALRSAAQYAAYLAATNPPVKRQIGFMR